MNSPNLNRIHNLKTVYLDFQIALKLIQSGYKFDDVAAPAAIGQLERSLNFLKEEISLIELETS